MKKRLLWVLKMATFYSTLGLILQAVCLNIVFAYTSVDAQNLKDVRVRMNAGNITLEQAFKMIERKTDFKFNYNNDQVNLNEMINLNLEDRSLYEILTALAKDYSLSFSRVNNQITVKKSNEQAPVLEQVVVENGTIKGKIYDAATKTPLAGATIALKGTTFGTYTDKKGEFVFLSIKPGSYTLSVSFIGYQAVTKKVTVESGKVAEIVAELSEGAVNLDEVVTTGTISERSVRAVANPVSIITAKEIEGRNLTNLSNILESIPGIEIAAGAESVQNLTTGTPYSQIYMRGGAPLSNVITSAGIKYFIDGIEVSDGSMLNRLNPNDIEKFEVSRGPMSSTLYGAGSSSGIVQIFTKRGWMNNLRVNFRTMFSSQESKYQDSNPINQNYNLNISGGSGDFGYSFGTDYTKTPVSRFESNNGIDYENLGFNAGVRAKVSTLIADLKLNYSTMTNGTYLNRYLYMTAVEEGWPLPSKFYYNLSDSKTVSEGITASLNLKQLLGSNWYHNLTIGYSKNGFQSDNYNNSGTATTPYYQGYYRDFRKYNARYYMNLNQSLFEGFNADITAGAEYVGYRFVDWGSMYTSPQKDYQSQSYFSGYGGFRSIYPVTTIGFFSEIVWGLNNNLFLTTGFRTEKNSGYGDDLGFYSMPRVGLTYVHEMGDFKFKPRFSMGKSTEPANPYYKIATGTGTSYEQLANPGLKPQTQSGWESGVDVYFSNWASFTVTYYKQKMENLITQIVMQRTPTYISQWQNVTTANNSGWELSGKIIAAPFTVDAAFSSVTSTYGDEYTSTTTNVRAGWRIPYIPSGSFFVRLGYRIPSLLPWTNKGGNVAFEYRWNGDVFSFDTYSYNKDLNRYQAGLTTVNPGATANYYGYFKELPGYGKLNLRFDYSVLDDLTLFADVYNLTNKQDWIGGSAPMMGRQISFGFNINY